MIMSPSVSIILPVYNAERFLKKTIESVLSQSYKDFELIIINDGSVDHSQQIIDSFDDRRIVKHLQANSGLAATLNKGLNMARGGLIARQDNDDISYTNRLEKQVAFMKANASTVLLGTAARIIDEHGQPTGRFHRHPTENAFLKFELLFDNPFVHSSVMFRKDAALDAGAYDTDTAYFEDYRLWSQLSKKAEVANLSDVLIDYREVNAGMSKSTSDYTDRVNRQSAENILDLLKGRDTVEITEFAKQSKGQGLVNVEASQKFDSILRQIIVAFVEAHKIQESDIAPAIAKIKRQFRRAYCNAVINSEESSLIKKLMAKIERRKLIYQLGA